MLEKDIENLIAKYPAEFLPYSGLKLVGQQVKLGSYFADLIFEDNQNSKIVIEIKRGILSREAVAQIMDYYGIIKTQDKKTNVELLIIANVIPKERVLLLAEKLDIKFLEIPAAKIAAAAKKYSYSFLDEVNPEVKVQYKEKTSNIDKEVLAGESNVWIFQSNPKTYDILNALGSGDELNSEHSTWLIKRYKEKIKKGDIALIWMSNTSSKAHDSGIYAVADIITNPEYMGSSSKYWIADNDIKKESKNLRVKLSYKILLLNNPILREELKSVQKLGKMHIFRQPQGTNFSVRQSEWGIISKIIKERLNT